MKIIVNEQQLNKLILFNINEQETEETKFDTVKLGDNFEYGKYQSNTVLNNIKELRKKIDTYIKDNDQATFTFNIVAGESQVTNPKGFEQKGSLALARSKEVNKYVNDVFSDLIKSKRIVVNSPQTISDVTIGTTPYGGPGSGDHKNPDLVPKYRLEQFVNIEISGKGLRYKKQQQQVPPTTQEKNDIPSFDICKTPRLVADGKYISAKQNYINRTKFPLGKGSGQIYFWSETYTMPDIIYIEYNGKSYGSTKFSGTDAPWTRLLLGTALINKYGVGGKLPAEYGNATFKEIKPDDPTFRSALMEAKNWGLQKSFVNVFGKGEELENDKIMLAFGEFDKRGSIKNLLNSLGNEFMWGTLTSEIVGSVQKNIVFPKSETINEAVVVNIAPNGGTNWTVGVTCQPF